LYSSLLAENSKIQNIQNIQNRVLRNTFGPKREEATGDWRKIYTRSFMIGNPHQILLGQSNRRRDGRGMLHVREEKRYSYRLWMGNLKERDNLEGLGVD
jgi:hypothetical protein